MKCSICDKFVGHTDGKCTLCSQDITRLCVKDEDLSSLLDKALGERYVASKHVMRTISFMLKQGISLKHIYRFIQISCTYFRTHQVIKLLNIGNFHKPLRLFHLFMPFTVDYWNSRPNKGLFNDLPVCYYYDEFEVCIFIQFQKGNKVKAMEQLRNGNRFKQLLNKTVVHRPTKIGDFVLYDTI